MDGLCYINGIKLEKGNRYDINPYHRQIIFVENKTTIAIKNKYSITKIKPFPFFNEYMKFVKFVNFFSEEVYICFVFNIDVCFIYPLGMQFIFKIILWNVGLKDLLYAFFILKFMYNF